MCPSLRSLGPNKYWPCVLAFGLWVVTLRQPSAVWGPNLGQYGDSLFTYNYLANIHTWPIFVLGQMDTWPKVTWPKFALGLSLHLANIRLANICLAKYPLGQISLGLESLHPCCHFCTWDRKQPDGQAWLFVECVSLKPTDLANSLAGCIND